jgi:hypothetical protein
MVADPNKGSTNLSSPLKVSQIVRAVFAATTELSPLAGYARVWRVTLNGWTVEIFHSQRRWHLAIILPKGFTRRFQPLPNFVTA